MRIRSVVATLAVLSASASAQSTSAEARTEPDGRVVFQVVLRWSVVPPEAVGRPASTRMPPRQPTARDPVLIRADGWTESCYAGRFRDALPRVK